MGGVWVKSLGEDSQSCKKLSAKLNGLGKAHAVAFVAVLQEHSKTLVGIRERLEEHLATEDLRRMKEAMEENHKKIEERVTSRRVLYIYSD